MWPLDTHKAYSHSRDHQTYVKIIKASVYQTIEQMGMLRKEQSYLRLQR